MTHHFDSRVISTMWNEDGALVDTISTCFSVLVKINFTEDVLTHAWLVLPVKLCDGEQLAAHWYCLVLVSGCHGVSRVLKQPEEGLQAVGSLSTKPPLPSTSSRRCDTN